MHVDIVANLRKEFKDNSEKYPEKPDSTWWIVLCESDGTPIKKTGEPIRPINPQYKIMQLASGVEKMFLTFPL